ncbi:MAG: DUF1588 domain-containing protein [Akkermansiaceae bacterium]|nr:DUF1588 domain-containing protein [Akkermansiaceae bacterium]
MRRFLFLLLVSCLRSQAAPPAGIPEILENRCTDCHDAETKKGNLDLTALPFDLEDPKTFAKWVKVHDRVLEHEMPPKNKDQPDAAEREKLLGGLSTALAAADALKIRTAGRSTWRRMNRYEYENTLRDLLGAPWLQVKDMLPEDGESQRFNKVGDALDVSHVQISRYLSAAEYALNEVLQRSASGVPSKVKRYYAREQTSLWRRSRFSEFNRSVERATFLIVGNEADIPALTDDDAVTVGLRTNDPVRREQESVGVVASSYEPLDISFNGFSAPASGRYKLRVKAKSFWAGPLDDKKWWKPVQDKVSAGRTEEPVSLYSEKRPRLLRKLGTFSVTPEESVSELDTYLVKTETIRPDAVRLFRSRPPAFKNPLAEKDGQPGVAFHWLEVEGPLPEPGLDAGVRLMFGNLPVKKQGRNNWTVTPRNPEADAAALLHGFLTRAYRRPPSDDDMLRFMNLARTALSSGASFGETMLTVYSAVLCSPEFVTLEEKPGALDAPAVAARLSYFLHNSEPPAFLRAAAAEGGLGKPEQVRAMADRLLDDRGSERFTAAFLDYWLDLRKVNATSPDALLYPDYYLDDYLVESSADETRAFFTELIKKDLPAANLVDSRFVMVNERLARHYGLEKPYQDTRAAAKAGTSDFLKVTLPADSPRGGLMTQASVLKVTANGTTTSPVLRGVWILERLVGKPVPPPPASVPAVEPDTRGATTIREQLDKHRSQESCNTCHVKIDPAGFALESFDVLGGWRDKYRALGEGTRTVGIGKNGQAFDFHDGPAVDCSGVLPDGRAFKDIRELKKLMLSDERQVARNLLQQLLVYSTGSPARFSDRPEVERILDRCEAGRFGVRTLIRELVSSHLFLHK